MKVNIIKPHGNYSLGITEVDDARGKYLIRSKVAEEVKDFEPVSNPDLPPDKEPVIPPVNNTAPTTKPTPSKPTKKKK